jgi:glutaredoxin
MTLKLFTKPGCKNCDIVKESCDLKDVEVFELDIDNHDALGELAFYEGVHLATVKMPILVIDDVTKISGPDKIVPYLNGGQA